MVLNGGGFAHQMMFGIVNIVNCHSWEATGCYWHLIDRGQGATEHPTMQRTAPHSKELSCPKCQSFPRLRNPEIRKSEVLSMVLLEHMLLYYTKIFISRNCNSERTST